MNYGVQQETKQNFTEKDSSPISDVLNRPNLSFKHVGGEANSFVHTNKRQCRVKYFLANRDFLPNTPYGWQPFVLYVHCT